MVTRTESEDGWRADTLSTNLGSLIGVSYLSSRSFVSACDKQVAQPGVSRSVSLIGETPPEVAYDKSTSPRLEMRLVISSATLPAPSILVHQTVFPLVGPYKWYGKRVKRVL